jgi:hypothetical protein
MGVNVSSISTKLVILLQTGRNYYYLVFKKRSSLSIALSRISSGGR